jgi:hypothetical protein
MEYSIFLTGILFIGVGFLVKAFPNILAGYNTMSKKEKANVDIENLSSFARNSLVGVGIALIFAELVMHFLSVTDWADYVNFPIIIGGVIFMLIGAQKYDHNK